MVKYATIVWLLLLAAQGRAEDLSMTLQKVEYLVGDLSEYPQQLTITQDGIKYESHSNLGRPASLGIGVYERPFSKEEMEAIESEFDRVSFQSLADHYGQVLSGDRWRRIRLTSGGETIEKLVGTKLPINPTLQKTIDWLDRLVDETTQHPRRVLQMSLQDATLDRDGEFSATMTLIGVGDQKVMFRPPQGQLDSPEGSLVLYWWPYDPGAPKKNVQYTRAISISQISTAKTHGALATFRIQSRLEEISLGTFIVQIQYSNMLPKFDAFDVLIGQLYSSPIVVR